MALNWKLLKAGYTKAGQNLACRWDNPWGVGGTSILDHSRDVRPEYVSFRGQKSVDGCKFFPKNLRMGHNSNV